MLFTQQIIHSLHRVKGNIGGLSAGILVALFLLPVYYALMNGDRKRIVLDL